MCTFAWLHVRLYVGLFIFVFCLLCLRDLAGCLVLFALVVVVVMCLVCLSCLLVWVVCFALLVVCCGSLLGLFTFRFIS